MIFHNQRLDCGNLKQEYIQKRVYRSTLYIKPKYNVEGCKNEKLC